MSNELPDYYGVLDVASTATKQEISRAYRALMRRHHPDLEGGTVSGGDGGLLRIMEAFAVLRDPKTRAEYDRALSISRVPRAQIDRGGPREVPVRKVHTPQPPLLRVSPVLWERGPLPGRGRIPDD
jgi:DnaJ family protein C protein 7